MNKNSDENRDVRVNAAVAYIVYPEDAQRRYADAADELPSTSRKREAIERKAKERGYEIVGEFVVSKKDNHIESSQFQNLVDFCAKRGVRYVMIYPPRPHRDHVKSALIEATLMRVGARVVSIHDTEDIPAQLRGILRMFSSYDTLARREAQLHGARKRRSAAA